MSGDPNLIMAMIEEKHGWRSDRPRMSEADAVATERSVTDMSSTGSKIEPREKLMATVTLSITRGSGDDRTPYRLRIKDDMSRSKICEIMMTGEEFAAAITGMLQTEVDAEWMNLERIGKIREVKEEVVRIPDGKYSEREAAASEAIKLYEIDGWAGCLEDALNHKRQVKPGYRRVSFTRYVDPIKE